MEIQQTLSFETTSLVVKKPSRLVFEQLVNETIDSVLSSLGTACRWAVYDYVEREHELKKNDVADHITEFSEALEQIFGDAAALLEIEMIRRLYRKVPQFKHSAKESLTFPEYVSALNHFFSNC